MKNHNIEDMAQVSCEEVFEDTAIIHLPPEPKDGKKVIVGNGYIWERDQTEREKMIKSGVLIDLTNK